MIGLGRRTLRVPTVPDAVPRKFPGALHPGEAQVQAAVAAVRVVVRSKRLLRC
jgi:hypothetical protein